MSAFDISFAGSFLVLLAILAPIALPFALAGFIADRIEAHHDKPMLLRNGGVRGPAAASHRYFHDVGDSA